MRQIKKHILAAILLLLINMVAFMPMPVKASDNILFSQEEQDQLNMEARKNRMETQTGSLINSVSGFIIDFLHLKDLVVLIYMRPVEHYDDEHVDTWVDKHNRNVFLDDLYAEIMKKYNELKAEHPVITGPDSNTSVYDFLFPFEIKFKHSTYRVQDQMVGIIGGENGLLFRVKSIDVTEFPDDLVFGLFPEPIVKLVQSVEEGFRIIAVYILIGIIAIAGFLMLLKSSSSSVQYFKEVTFGILLALVVLMFAITVMKMLGDLNRFGVNLAYVMLDPDERGTSFVNMLYNKNTQSLGMAIVSIIAVFMIATMNFQYMVRLISLTALCTMSPVVAVVSIFPSSKDSIGVWINELVSNIFMQTCHAFTLTFFLKMVNAFASDPILKPSTFWLAMAGIMGINSVYMLVRSMLGLSQFNNRTAPGMIGNLLGLGAMLGVGRLAMAFAGNKNKTDSRAGITGNSATDITPKSVPAGYPSAASTIAGMFSNLKQPQYSAIGETLKKGMKLGGAGAGAALLGLTGGMITAASGFDPAGGMILGSELGLKAGGRVGGVLGDTGSAARMVRTNGGLPQYIKNKAGFHDGSQYRDVQEMIQMGRNLTGGNLGAAIGETLGRYNKIRAERYSPKDSVRARELQAISSFKDERAEMQDTLSRRKADYELEKTKMEALRANVTALDPEQNRKGWISKEVRKAVAEYNEQKSIAAEAEKLFKESMADFQEKSTLEYMLKTLSEYSGRSVNHGYGGAYNS